ncbi:hypothetical protein AB0K00_14880 [Dactylosporangium sp. NPDC049525]|uniref:hypothetical protein n=1 Tax=Dactylosporangium sp. NPDC049525 TaxID=3154730 RepID=UPI0034331695
MVRTVRRLASCTTDSLGYCTVPHGLGRTPAAVLATVSSPNSGPRIASQIDTDQFTAGTFRVRVGTPTGDAFSSGAVTFSYAAFVGAAPVPSPISSASASPEASPAST